MIPLRDNPLPGTAGRHFGLTPQTVIFNPTSGFNSQWLATRFKGKFLAVSPSACGGVVHSAMILSLHENYDRA